jgi:hypothetical protein
VELLTRGLSLPDPHSLYPQLNLLNPHPKQNSLVCHWMGISSTYHVKNEKKLHKVKKERNILPTIKIWKEG